MNFIFFDDKITFDGKYSTCLHNPASGRGQKQFFYVLLHKLYTNMSKLNAFIRKRLSGTNRYWVAITVFAVITFVAGESNLYTQYTYSEKIHRLEMEIRSYREEIELTKRKLEDLRAGKERLERFAREEYFMKKPDEDIFIIVDK
jgi:cell division protein FtsB